MASIICLRNGVIVVSPRLKIWMDQREVLTMIQAGNTNEGTATAKRFSSTPDEHPIARHGVPGDGPFHAAFFSRVDASCAVGTHGEIYGNFAV
jgi:hypothetical protein